MPLVIQASLRVRGLTSEPHHWWAMVLASRRMPVLSPTREPRIAASSGAQTAGRVSSGSSTTFRWVDSGAPKLSVKKSYSLAAVWARSLADCWWLTVS